MSGIVVLGGGFAGVWSAAGAVRLADPGAPAPAAPRGSRAARPSRRG